MKKIFLMALNASILAGCADFLDREPYASISTAIFWQTEDDLANAVNVLYNDMNRDWTLDVQSADAFGAAGNTVSSGTYAAPNADDVWTTAYQQIRNANNFLENYAKADVADATKNRYAGEARFFRAYYYFNLIKRFGDVPYVTKTLDLGDDELEGPRDSKETILNGIIDDLKYAEENIPAKSDGNDNGRVTKGAAQAFLARVALYFGTYYKAHGGSDNYKSYLTEARDAAKRCMDSGEYGLEADYLELFLHDESTDSPEIILAFRYSEINTYNSRIRATIVDYDHEPTKYLADAFLCTDGLPIDKSPLFKGYLPLGAEWENRDPRMRCSIWQPYDGENFNGSPFVPDLGVQTRTGYMFRKYGLMSSYGDMKQYIDEILIRYAEVLLSYAEACYELNGAISDSELDASVNALRRRFPDGSRLPDLTNAFATANNLDMRSEIRRERRVELCGEALRYDDIIRWKIADEELDREILGACLDTDVYGTTTNILDDDGFILVQAAGTRSFTDPKNYLFPIPLKEMSLHPDWEQNPGW